MFENTPAEMRNYRQWIVWRYEETDTDKPTKVPYSIHNHRMASVRNPDHWSTFEDCVNILRNQPNLYSGLGFVLTPHDPYTFLDLDDTKGNQEAFQRQQLIYNEFVSYAEWSPSGNGLHIIVRGDIPSGRRRSTIEMYSDMRFMTMTGNVYRDCPINDHQDMLMVLYAQMGANGTRLNAYEGTAEQLLEDEEVLNIASSAQNGEKFHDLYTGNWEKYYGSQSDADMALVDIIAYYTQNKEQIVRMFHESALGQRDKAKRVDYLGYMLAKCFDNMLPMVDLDGLRNKLDEYLAEKSLHIPDSLREGGLDDYTDGTTDSAPEVHLEAERSAYSVPPGLMGEIAQFVYSAAPRPVPEIALVAAMGLMSGIVGRAYNVSGTGLNAYTLLLAKTGVGKEAIARGIEKLMRSIVGVVAASADFVGPAEIASSQALIKYMSKGKNSFVSTVGEFGMYLQQMSSDKAPPHMVMLRRTMLDLFNKSGEGSVLRPSVYSDSEKNTAAVLAPNFSLIGESTPVRFYEGLHEGMISEGLLPRFTIIEYHGPRPPLNNGHHSAKPSAQLSERMATICAHALALNAQNKVINVGQCPATLELFERFNLHCDDMINGAGDGEDAVHQMWNRAHIKALKLAATVAVGCNPYDPVITLDIAHWSINLIVTDVQNMVARFRNGDIGGNDLETQQLQKTMNAFKDYIVLPWSKVCKYVGRSGSRMHAERILPYAYLQRRLAAVACFRNDPQRGSAALKRTIRTMIERGDIAEVPRAVMAKDHDSGATAYVVVNPGALGL